MKDNIKKWKLNVFLAVLVMLLFIPSIYADLAATSQMGYHPLSNKQVVVYTSSLTGTFDVENKDGIVIFSDDLKKAKDYTGNDVNCQGNNPCLVGDFTDLVLEGTYRISATTGEKTDTKYFDISEDIYLDNINLFSSFYDALRQQNSTFHADLNGGYDPAFTDMADGSFIMLADQAALTLIRLGSAYRMNPAIFDDGLIMTMERYVDYLASLQGLTIKESANGDGFRLNPSMKVTRAFVPGPTNLTTLDVYIPGNPPQKLTTVAVDSLCGKDDGSAAWDGCIIEAEDIFKCQIDEPCIELDYIDKTGMIESTDAGYAVSSGWAYEFGCYFDVDLENGNFNSGYNPCMIFDDTVHYGDTTKTLLGFLEAYPAILNRSQTNGLSILGRAIATEKFIEDNYAGLLDSESTAFYGAALFLLYDYTGDIAYLKKAHSYRNSVSHTLQSDMTHGNEFYWEEYIRHKQAMYDNLLSFGIAATSPTEYFRGKIFFDYKDAGATSMSKTAERVFQFDNNIQFQNSRYILTEGLMAAKTLRLHDAPEGFVKNISDNQIAWMTGMNLIQEDVGLSAPARSYSFIFGIGDFPSSYHSRLIVNSGYSDKTSGDVVGIRGTSLQFLPEGESEYVYLDGKANILGNVFGSSGNGWNNESKTEPFLDQVTFNNGMTYIPGWINGAFDINTNPQETDTIFNYADTTDTYEFTETTNEIIATAVEYFAYLDKIYNGRKSVVVPAYSADTSLTVSVGLLDASVFIDSIYIGLTGTNGKITIAPIFDGTHDLRITKEGYGDYDSTVKIIANIENKLAVILTPATQKSTIKIILSTPNATVFIDSIGSGLTDINGDHTIENITLGNHLITLKKAGYIDKSTNITTIAGNITEVSLTLQKAFGSINISDSTPNAVIYLDGVMIGNLDLEGKYLIGYVPVGLHEIALMKEGYETEAANITIIQNVVSEITFHLTKITTGSLLIDRSTSDAAVYVDTLFSGTTDQIGTLLITDIIAGTHNISLKKHNHLESSKNVTITIGTQSVISITLEELYLTDIQLDNLTENYMMFETETAKFTTKNYPNESLNWHIDGKFVQMTNPPDGNHSFLWKPGVFFSDGQKRADVTVTDGTNTHSWTIDVKGVLNPFFSDSDDDENVTAYIYTNNDFATYKKIELQLITPTETKTISLNNRISGHETVWSAPLTYLPQGTTYMSRITTTDSSTDETTSYNFTNERGYYVAPPKKAKKFDDVEAIRLSRNVATGGGGGGGIGSSGTMDVVYAIFENDVITINEFQTIVADVKNFNGGIDFVRAMIENPDGEPVLISLNRISGTEEYGTWSKSFYGFRNGTYHLKSFLIGSGIISKTVPMDTISFYVTEENDAKNTDTNETSNFEIIYTILSRSKTTKGSNVFLTLDAKDHVGIEKIDALVENSNGETQVILLSMTTGKSTYGTWRGMISADEPDTTYSVRSITMMNFEGIEKEIIVDSRSFYVEADPKSGVEGLNVSGERNRSSGITGFNILDAIKEPFFPTKVGFIMMAIIGGFFMIPMVANIDGRARKGKIPDDYQDEYGPFAEILRSKKTRKKR